MTNQKPNTSSPRIIFMGTPEFAVPSMTSLHEKYGLQAVVTVPDKPRGRGQKLMASPVKAKALELGIPVLQPESLKDEGFISELKSYEPDIFCVLAFRILPEEVYTIPHIASFNIHGSLLPKYRGAAPINRAIMAGETQSGLTSFVLQKKVDTGDILLTRKINISSDWTAGDLHDAMMPLAAELSIDTCELLIKGDYSTFPQDGSIASPAPKIFREDCHIDCSQTAEQVYNHIRGLSPYPAAWTTFEGKGLKILRAEIAGENIAPDLKPGEYQIDKNGFYLGCAGGALKLTQLKPEGKPAMDATSFINGYRGNARGRVG